MAIVFFTKSSMEAAIDKTWKDFFARDLPSKKKGKERYFGIYTDYDGPNFSFFCGVEVDSFVGMSSDLQSMMIPAQNYAKLTEFVTAPFVTVPFVPV